MEGKVIFIENVIPGDVVDVRLLKSKKDWAEGYPLTFHHLSPERVTPFCTHFGDCGGCQWQMVSYEQQLIFKQKQVQDTLQRIGKIPMPDLLPIIGAVENRYYRNKLEYTFGVQRYIPEKEFKKDSKLEVPLNPPQGEASPSEGFSGAAGFHAKGFFDKVVDIQTCFLQAEPTNAIRLLVKEFVRNNGWSFYDIPKHNGFLRTMQVRLCTTGELMVNIVVAEDDESKIKLLLDHVLKNFPLITTLLYTINTKWNDSLYDLEPVTYHGKGYVIEKLSEGPTGEDFLFKIGPKSFFQTNTKQAEQLYRVTREFTELSGKETVYDLYCGTGSISIFVSKNAKKIIGVEMIAAAVDDARQNAALNNLSRAEFFTGDVIAVCNDDFFTTHGRPDVIIIDPPRAGMHEKLVKKILELATPVVVYVSCNPATQARDLNLLDEKYAVTKIQPVDMFPHTHHIENVVQLKLKKR